MAVVFGLVALDFTEDCDVDALYAFMASSIVSASGWVSRIVLSEEEIRRPFEI